MRGRELLLLIAILAATAPGLIDGPTVTVNFDRDPFGDPIADGQPLNDVYARFGLLFERIGGGGCGQDGVVFANDDRGDETAFASAPNVVSICGAGDFSDWNEIHGVVRVELERPGREACVAVKPSGSDGQAFLRTVDLAGEPLQTVTSSPGVLETLCVTGDGFRRVEFAGSGSVGFARFDDLRITYAPRQVDFDRTREGPVEPGSAVDGLYADLGVLFEQVGGRTSACDDETVYANSDQGPGDEPVGSVPNVVTPCPERRFSDFNGGAEGVVRARFEREASSACVGVFPSSDSDRGFLRALDASGEVLAEGSSPDGSEGSLCVEGERIRALEFAGADEGYARFDDLEFVFGAAVLDFDRDSDGEPIEAGAVVNERYEGLGVLLQRDGVRAPSCGEGDAVYASDDLPDGFGSSPNAVSVCNTRFSDFSEGREGLVHALFAVDAVRVCVDVTPTGSDDFATLRAYDGNDELVGEELSTAGVQQTLCIEQDGVRGVRFAGFEDRYARFDDLVVHTSAVLAQPAPATVYFVPEPSSELLTATALVVLASLAMARARSGARLSARRRCRTPRPDRPGPW
jgi:hypothetical protein